jgi:hypothetical protein
MLIASAHQGHNQHSGCTSSSYLTVALYSLGWRHVFHAQMVMSARDAKRLIIASILLHLEMLMAAAEDDDEIRAATLVICARASSRSQHTTRAHTLMVF